MGNFLPALGLFSGSVATSSSSSLAVLSPSHHPVRPPSYHPVMSPLHLATVELRLIMQCLDKITLLHLARCSKFTLASASSDFTWKFLSPMLQPLTFSRQRFGLAHQISSSLLRHVAVSIRWTNASVDQSVMDDGDVPAEELDAVREIPRIQVLVIERKLRWEHLMSVLSNPSLRSLTALEFIPLSEGAADWSRLMFQNMQHLRVLSLDLWHTSAILGALPGLTQLTDVRLSAYEISNADIASLGQCVQLRRLSLEGFERGEYTRLLTAPRLRDLQHLIIRHTDWWDDLGIWKTCFRALRQLRSLELIGCTFVHSILWDLTQSDSKLLSLRVVMGGFRATLNPGSMSFPNFHYRYLPNSCTSVLLQLCPLDSYTSVFPVSAPVESLQPEWNRLRDSLVEVAQQHPKRVTFQMVRHDPFPSLWMDTGK
jgi:hypothetical protein